MTAPLPQAVRHALLQRPALLYERMLRQGPMHWSDQAQSWVVVGYDLARAVLRDNRFRMPAPDPRSVWSTDPELSAFMRGMMLQAEGPRHQELRRAVAQRFTPRMLKARRSRIVEALHGILDGLHPATRVEAVADISVPFPVAVVGDVIGIPRAQRDEVSDLCRRISSGGGLVGGVRPPSRAVDDSITAVGELGTRVRGWLAEPELLEPDSVLTDLHATRARGGGLSDAETVAVVFSLHLAGHDTSRNLFSALAHRLATDPTMLPALARADLDAATVVNTVLLDEPPLTFTARMATCDVELAGHQIRAGQRVRVMLGAANHDLTQQARPHQQLDGLAFGEGMHVCLGSHLAREEGALLLDVLAARWSSVRLAEDPRWNPHFLVRGLAELPLEVTWKA
ncbi:cytochrome P450 [Micromonospora sp. ATCC 39149]|uniref:Cytochrome P450 n=1 Tax=Micromonospora carbonacea TaxID=47853 RepID=A0A7D6CF74_9ACTN|nr:cytochrome P450 [Micromonospora sp. ATCC 39149]QLJ99528.1 cytochrome P450 [Micromonospora carbonacea]